MARTNYFRILVVLIAVCLAAGLLLALVGTKQAEAAFPGQNGKLFYVQQSFGSDGVYAINPDGSDSVGVGGGIDPHPAVSPDGTKIATDWRDFASVSGNMYIYDVDGGGWQEVTTGLYFAQYPAWSPTGNVIAFIGYSSPDSQYADLYTIGIDGSGLDNVTEGRVKGIRGRPAFSPLPAAWKIAFAGQNPDWEHDPNMADDTSMDILSIDPDGDDLAALTHDFPRDPQIDDTDPTWSPDGEKIAFTRYAPWQTQSSQYDIYTMEFDGSGLDNVTKTEETQESLPAWSPNNNKIAFVSYLYEDHWDLRTVDPDGSDVAVVPNAYAPSYIDWARAETTAPSVTSITPEDDAEDVKADENGGFYVEATFSEPMDRRTIDRDRWSTEPRTFTLTEQGSSTPVEEASVWYDPEAKKAVLYLYKDDVEGDTTYTATLKGGSSGVKDFYGNPLPEDESWSFTTYDTVAPETTITSGPTDNSVSGSSVSFAFSSSEPDSTFECSLDNTDFEPCTSPKSYNGLSDGWRTFQVRAKDAAGNVDYSSEYRSWTVDAKAPTVYSDYLAPTDGEDDVSVDINVEAYFSEVMDPDTLTDQTFTLTKEGSSSPVAAHVSYDNTVLTLDPGSSLEANTTYTATIEGGSSGATDLIGNALEQNFSWTFTTEPPPDTTPPQVSGLTATNVSTTKVPLRRTNFKATFSEAMDRTTLTKPNFQLFKCASATSTVCTTRITDVKVTSSADGRSATLNPYGSKTTLLQANARYKIVVIQTTRDLAGNNLDQDPNKAGNQPKITYFKTGSS